MCRCGVLTCSCHGRAGPRQADDENVVCLGGQTHCVRRQSTGIVPGAVHAAFFTCECAAHVVGFCAETVVCAGCCAAGQAYVAEQTESCASFRTESCLRLRDQVARLQSLLSDAPSVGIADATVRAIRSAGEQSTSVLSDYSREARCVSSVNRWAVMLYVRLFVFCFFVINVVAVGGNDDRDSEMARLFDEHNIQLVPQLSDPNKVGCRRQLLQLLSLLLLLLIPPLPLQLTRGRSSRLGCC